MWYLVLILSMFGETMTTTFTPIHGAEACEKARAQIVQGLAAGDHLSPKIKLAQCIRSY